ncbi:permease [Plebeiibacterium marinum]|uniref:Permease n=1 Tax=Plebeiibacterium marinum TaxID=2992111 RepID=A0AAE3SIR5_9BACT|nr:permease [Plebeiobacterium marinum]MCW3804907.1 permease [Plebeiobacterium marinum]
MISGNIASVSKKQNSDINIGKLAIWFVLLVLVADTIYSTWYGINLQTREKCVIYKFMPRWLFMTYEYLFELFMVVIAGAFAGSVTEKYFKRYKKLIPQNQVTAFFYASLIPVCSCSAIPLIESMKRRLKMRTIISFVMSAPILNPYVIYLSFSVIGFKYGVLRILGAFVVSIITGIVMEIAHKKMGNNAIGVYNSCRPKVCSAIRGEDVYMKTWKMVFEIAPYVFIAGFLGLILEISGPLKVIEQLPLNDHFVSLLIFTLIGTFIYMCNGADVLFLAPLLRFTDLGLGVSIGFSLSATAICTTSIIMLFKFLGKRLTTVLVLTVYLVIVLFSYLSGMIV